MKKYDEDTWIREQRLWSVMLQIISEVEKTIPSNIPAEIHEAIFLEILPNSRNELEDLTAEDLTNTDLIERYVGSAIDTAQYFVGRIQRIDTGMAMTDAERECTDCAGSGALDLWSGEQCQRCHGTGNVA